MSEEFDFATTTSEAAETSVHLRVRELRSAQKMSLKKLAHLSGVSYNTALAYDRDAPRYFRRDVLAAMARALNVSVKDLVEDAPADSSALLAEESAA